MGIILAYAAVVKVVSAEITSGQRQYSAFLSSCHAFRNEIRTRDYKMAAKAGKDVFVEKRYMQRGPEQASQNRPSALSRQLGWLRPN